MSYVRRSLYAGQWFPADASALHDLIEDQLRQTPAGRDSAGLVAIVVPHAGLAYSGTVAAAAYQHLIMSLLKVRLSIRGERSRHLLVSLV